MSRFEGTITGRDYSTYEPAWKTEHLFEHIPRWNPIVADYKRKISFREAVESRFPDWRVKDIRTDAAAGMVTMELVPADGTRVRERCDHFSCDLLEVW